MNLKAIFLICSIIIYPVFSWGQVFSTTPQSLHFPASGGEGKFTINVDFNTVVSISCQDGYGWLTCPPISNNGYAREITVTVKANTRGDTRQAIIKLKDTKKNKVITVGVFQDGVAQQVLSVEPNSLNFTASKEEKTLTVTSNLQWRLSCDAKWLKFALVGGTIYGNGTLSVTAEQNTSTTPRTATVTFTGGDQKCYINITQAEMLSTSVSIDSLKFTAASYQQFFTISSNTAWTISNDDASWLTVSPTSGTNNGAVCVTTKANTGTKERTATITINSKGTTKKSIRIIQAASQQGLKHTWNLTPTMCAILDISNGVLTIKTTKGSETMPYNYNRPWESVKLNIYSVVIEEGVKNIANSAFKGFDNLTSVTMPNSLSTIGDESFSDCINLTSVTIPNSTISIGEKSFSSCRKLISLSIGNSVTTIGRNAFSSCSSLESLVIPNSVIIIEDDSFSRCGLNSVSIGNSVTSIGYGCFQHCSNLSLVTMQESITSIGNNAFYGCSNLKKIAVNWVIPLLLHLSSHIFIDVKTSDVILSVPAGSENLYKTAPIWKDFKIQTSSPTNIEKVNLQSLKAHITNNILHVSGLPIGCKLNIYNMTGRLIYSCKIKAEEEMIPFKESGIFVIVAGNNSIKVSANK